MTATTETRKRSREDDSCDSMPLSKRINNLHINNGIQDFAANGNSLAHGSNTHHPMQHMNGGGGGHEAHPALRGENCFASQIAEANPQEPLPPGYSPELTQHENPYYYNKNKLLYELHLERMRRTHHP